MTNNEIKKANRNAMPKFIIIVLISAILGGAVGYFAAEYGFNTMSESISAAAKAFGTHFAPWILVALAVMMPCWTITAYRSAKNLIRSWDGEDEEVYATIDNRLSVVLWLSSTAIILGFFLITATYSVSFALIEDGREVYLLFVSIVAFLVIFVEALIIQQKCVDAIKSICPEKKASIYDVKFQKKWMDSCDEAEKITIGKCAYKAYAASNTTCTVLAVVLAVCALIFETSFLPALVVCIIWGVNQFVYFKEAMKYSKAGNEISQ